MDFDPFAHRQTGIGGHGAREVCLLFARVSKSFGTLKERMWELLLQKQEYSGSVAATDRTGFRMTALGG
ncbi:hypothetical protein DVR09_10900 [Erythrobacter aureus]|uniref:Uncharacterized protein n=1 Tax=Erythrobacter aureus TaxID=2182384 RepID=A0A345YFR6_9SPHN|nr:hypothetical protein DVR09_10900 [Erythrobacter aureus]